MEEMKKFFRGQTQEKIKRFQKKFSIFFSTPNPTTNVVAGAGFEPSPSGHEPDMLTITLSRK